MGWKPSQSERDGNGSDEQENLLLLFPHRLYIRHVRRSTERESATRAESSSSVRRRRAAVVTSVLLLARCAVACTVLSSRAVIDAAQRWVVVAAEFDL